MATVALGTNGSAGSVSATSTENQCTLSCPAGGALRFKNKADSANEVLINVESVHETGDWAQLEVGDTMHLRPGKSDPVCKFKTNTGGHTATLSIDRVLLNNRTL